MEFILMILAIILVAFVFFLAHNYSHKKLLISVSCILSLVFVWFQYRHFYKVNDITFTVWKRWGGYCYIMPYKYFGCNIPQDNYIKLSNVGNVVIYLDTNNKLVIFNTGYTVDSIVCKLKNYQYQYFTLNKNRTTDDILLYNELMKSYQESGNPCIGISAREMLVDIYEE